MRLNQLNSGLGYLYEVAANMMGRLKIYERLDARISAAEFSKRFWNEVYYKIEPTWKPQALGRIAAYGISTRDGYVVPGGRHHEPDDIRTNIYEVHDGPFGENRTNDGYFILVCLATSVIVAAMVDLMKIHFKKQAKAA